METPSGEVTVLGTSFSVTERRGDIKVNVATGKVKLSPKGSPQSIIMTANEQGIFKKSTGNLLKESTLSLNDLSWHTKKLAYDSAPLGDALKEIGQFYGIGIVVEKDIKLLCPITATFEDKSLETVLETMAALFGAEIREEGSGKYVMKGVVCE